MTTTTAPPPSSPVEKPRLASGPLAWVKKNLFRTWFDTALTLIVGYVVISAGFQFLTWALTQAEWRVVTVNFRSLMQGLYPLSESWRPALALTLVVLLAGASWGIWGKLFRSTFIGFGVVLALLWVVPLIPDPQATIGGPFGRYLAQDLIPLFNTLKLAVLLLIGSLVAGYVVGRMGKRANRQQAARITLIGWLVLIPVAFVLVGGLTGNSPPLPIVPTNLWGGLLLTFMFAFVAIVACFPLGVVLALGRFAAGTQSRARMPRIWRLPSALIQRIMMVVTPIVLLAVFWVQSGITAFDPRSVLDFVEYLFVRRFGDFVGLLLLVWLAEVLLLSKPGALLQAISIWWKNQGNYPLIALFCTVFIEFFRGIPLVTVLFTANLIVPLALGGVQVENLVRAMVGMSFFQAAYVAEIVRGGLQALPPGQLEAAKALGLNPVQATLFITLPQAIRIVIPVLVGQFISLFKDTSLAVIIGLLDLLGTAQSVTAQAEFQERRREAYVFIFIVYFVFSYGMSYAARQLERTGSGRLNRQLR